MSEIINNVRADILWKGEKGKRLLMEITTVGMKNVMIVINIADSDRNEYYLVEE